jgi:AraC-like DNA-binding protein
VRKLSISVHFVRAVLHHCIDRGVDPLPLLRRHRITPRLLREPQARVAIERFADLQVAVMRALGDESLGYSERPIPLGSWTLMCHAVIGSANLGQAFARFCRFYGLFGYDLTPVFEVGEREASVALSDRGAVPADPYFKELLLFNAHRFGSWLVQEHLPLLQATLDYAPAAQPDDYRRMFLANPVSFEDDRCALRFPAGLLERPVLQNEATLKRFLRHPVLIMLTQEYDRASWTAQVREQVRRNVLAMPELAEVAAALQVHPQTLRRRLAREGTSFKDIKNQLRRDVALHYLGREGLSIEDIAHRAGFSEASAFIRAFKGWTGVTPYAYRKGL